MNCAPPIYRDEQAWTDDERANNYVMPGARKRTAKIGPVVEVTGLSAIQLERLEHANS